MIKEVVQVFAKESTCRKTRVGWGVQSDPFDGQVRIEMESELTGK